MRTQDMDHWVQLPEEEAVQRSFNTGNHLNLRRFLFALGLTLPIVVIALLAQGRWLLLPVPVIHLLAIRGAFLLMETETFERHFRRFLIALLLLQLAAFAFYDTVQWSALHNAAVFAPVVILAFRLKTEEYLVLYGTCWGSVFVLDLVLPVLRQGAIRYEPLLASTGMLAVLFPVAILITRRRRRRFLESWRIERGRSLERLRMREELESARRIQVQMLPGGDPDLEWLDLASLSLPATEVGGDYYDYFVLPDGRLAIAIGDVAGHGVGSGILLSGIRSCLYLLHEYEAPPLEILEKLHRVVAETAVERMFMTLLYAIFDQEAGTLTVTMAGHPPVLHLASASQEVQEVGTYNMPLGTRLFRPPEVHTVPVARGDIFVLYTDGLFETLSTDDREYGFDRLRTQLRQCSHLSAKQTRDRLLNDVWAFKSDARQRDDVTMVIAKLR